MASLSKAESKNAVWGLFGLLKMSNLSAYEVAKKEQKSFYKPPKIYFGTIHQQFPCKPVLLHIFRLSLVL